MQVNAIIEEIQSLLQKKGFTPNIHKSRDFVFITVDRVVMIAIHLNGNIEFSRSTDHKHCRCQYKVTEEILMKMLKEIN